MSRVWESTELLLHLLQLLVARPQPYDVVPNISSLGKWSRARASGTSVDPALSMLGESSSDAESCLGVALRYE